MKKLWQQSPFLLIGLIACFFTLWIPATPYSKDLSQKKFTVNVQNIRSFENRFGKRFYCYYLSVDGKEYTLLHKRKNYLELGHRYEIFGKEALGRKGSSYIKPNSKISPVKLSKAPQFLPTLKESIRKSIKAHFKKLFPNHHELVSASFLGEPLKSLTKFRFSKFQLAHLLVISGFHLSLISLSFFSLLSHIISVRKAALVTIALLVFYVILLGTTAPILRACICQLIFLIGVILRRVSLGLNSLGLALLMILIMDRSLISQTGCILSFSLTASIFCFYPFYKDLLKRKIPSILLPIAAFTLAIETASIPLSLYFFHKISLLGMTFNLFMPLLFSAFMIIALLASMLFIIPYLSTALELSTEFLASLMTNWVYFPWEHYDFFIRFGPLGGFLTIITLLIMLVIFFTYYKRSVHIIFSI